MNNLAGTFLPPRTLVAGDEGFIDSDSVAGGGPSAGTLLRHARETAGITILALAVALKVPVKKLEALEADRIDLLPDAVFARALASSVCRTLKIDPSLILSQLPKTGSHRLANPGEHINTPFKTPSAGYRLSVWSQISKPAILAGLVLVLGALVLWLLPVVRSTLMDVGGSSARPTNSRDGLGSPMAQATPATSAAEAEKSQMTKLEAESRQLLSASAPESRPVGGVEGFGPPALATAIPAPTAASPGPAVSTVNALASDATPAFAAVTPAGAAVTDLAAGIVAFKASGVSWVEVTDARGQVVLRRTLNAGEVASASGALPLAAVVGRADVTQVQVRGKTIDTMIFAKDNVARFEVK